MACLISQMPIALRRGIHERAIALYKSGYYYEAKRKGLEGTLGKARPRRLPVTIKDARVSPAPATTVSPSSRVLPMSSSVAQTAPAEVAAGASGDVLVPPEPPRRPADFEATPTDLPTKDAVPAKDSNRLIEPEFSDCLIQLQRIGITAEQASTAKNSNAACVIENPVRLKSLKASGEQTVTFPDGPILGCRFAERFGQWVGELAVPRSGPALRLSQRFAQAPDSMPQPKPRFVGEAKCPCRRSGGRYSRL